MEHTLFKIKASIKVLKISEGGSRTTPFRRGYIPDFDFGDKSLKGGLLLVDKNKLVHPGDRFECYITFNDDRFLGKNFGIGTSFYFYEGRHKIGEGKVLEVVGFVTNSSLDAEY